MSKLSRQILRAAGVDILMGDSEQYTMQGTDDGPRVHRECSGEYTIEEVRAMLRDMEAIQAAWDAGKLRPIRYVEVDVSAYYEKHGVEPQGRRSWIFRMGDEEERYSVVDCRYEEARAHARNYASEAGYALVKVMP